MTDHVTEDDVTEDDVAEDDVTEDDVTGAATRAATGDSGGRGPRPVVAAVRPEPDPAVLAAIVAAVEQSWPQPAPPSAASRPATSTWRFSGRWWARPMAARRERPWLGGAR